MTTVPKREGRAVKSVRIELVTIRMPASVWKLLRRTLELDAESIAFDPLLRKQLKRALAEVEVLDTRPTERR